MVSAFAEKGFVADDCEFLYADNSKGNEIDAFAAANRFLQAASGRYVVLCHQDILPLADGRVRLDAVLADLTAFDPDWGLCGNAGGAQDGSLVYCLTHGTNPARTLEEGGPFPRQVMSLDENFIIVRKEANLALSHDLAGFHWYGADLCIVAATLGWNAYVIDFHLHHQSTGTLSKDFREIGTSLRKKYARAFRSRWHHVPMSQPVFLSASPLGTFFARASHAVGRRLGFAWRS